MTTDGPGPERKFLRIKRDWNKPGVVLESGVTNRDCPSAAGRTPRSDPVPTRCARMRELGELMTRRRARLAGTDDDDLNRLRHVSTS